MGTDLRSSMELGYGLGEYKFADENNLEHCVKYLNQTLVIYGFPASLDLQTNDPVSVAHTCNCIYALLQQRKRDIDFRESSNEQRQRMSSDMSRLESKVERLEAQVATKERELAALTRTEQKAAAAFKAQIEKLQQERDEFQRMVIGNQQVRTQQIHEMKKKEKEYIKLQERLNQVLMEKKKESRSGIEIMNLLQKEGRQRGTWNGKKADGDFYKMIVDAYETKKQELMAENADLRALLRSMQLDMRNFLNTPSGLTKSELSTNGGVDAEPPATPLGGRTDVFDLPFHMARDQIEQSLRTKMASIKERMLQLQEAQKGAQVTCEASERELELEAQLVEARSIIQEQASIMSRHLAKSENSRRVMGHLDADRDSVLSTQVEDRATLQGRTKQMEADRSTPRRMSTEPDKNCAEDEPESWLTPATSWTSDVGGSAKFSRKAKFASSSVPVGSVGGLFPFRRSEVFRIALHLVQFGTLSIYNLIPLLSNQILVYMAYVSNNEMEWTFAPLCLKVKRNNWTVCIRAP